MNGNPVPWALIGKPAISPSRTFCPEYLTMFCQGSLGLGLLTRPPQNHLEVSLLSLLRAGMGGAQWWSICCQIKRSQVQIPPVLLWIKHLPNKQCCYCSYKHYGYFGRGRGPGQVYGISQGLSAEDEVHDAMLRPPAVHTHTQISTRTHTVAMETIPSPVPLSCDPLLSCDPHLLKCIRCLVWSHPVLSLLLISLESDTPS